MTATVEPGDVIAGRYRLERLIGEGGMGIVWAATDLEKETVVALKHLRAEASGDAETRKRFLREAQATAAVAHPNIVAVHDFVETPGGLPAIVMDLLEGEPLAARLDRDKKIPLAEAATILLPAISAVGTAHTIGIVHRDLKPDNIFIAREPSGEAVIKVLDFGIAKLTKTGTEVTTASVITGTWSLLGTPHYMSPEQIIGEKDIDHRADIWALGAILYECLAGVRPAEAKTPGKIFELILLKGIKPLEAAAPGTPADVAKLVARMLSRERDDRPWDLHEVEQVLSRYTEVKAPPFGKPAAIRLSNPLAAEARRPAREKVEPLAAQSDPMSTTAPDLRNVLAQLSFEDAPGEPPSTVPDMRGQLEALAPALAKSALAAPPPDAPKSTDAKKRLGSSKLSPAAIAVFIAVGAVGAGVGAWLGFVRGGGDADPSSGGTKGAPTGSAAPTGALPGALPGAGACPPGMALIAGGAFLMGSSDGREDERPVHRVEVRPFCLDKTEVTVEAYAACVATGACTRPEATVAWDGISEAQRKLESADCLASQGDRQDHPINCVDWTQADKFCRARGKRLPTEEEWEYAARGGGKQRRHPWGDAQVGPELANLCGAECREALKKRGRELPAGAGAAMEKSDGFPTTAPVGRFLKGDSLDGVHDLTGNVWEWTASAYCPYPSHTCSNPARVFRGAGWMTFLPAHLQPTARLYSAASNRYADTGFRCAAGAK